MLHFPDNIRLIQFLALFNSGLLFVEISQRRIQSIVEQLSVPDVAEEDVQEAGEELSTLLGRVLEIKIRSRRILDIVEDLQ